MDAPATSAAPIYDLLIAERGDAVPDAARIAEQTWLEAADILGYGSRAATGDNGTDAV